MIATTLHIYCKPGRYNSVSRWRNIILVLILLIPGFASSQSNEEIIVSVNVQRIGLTEMPAIIQKETVYLPVNLVFDFIKIQNRLSPDMDSDEGFFITPKATFIIDKKKSRIVYQSKIFNLQPGDLIQTETNLYLRSDYFGEVFGLQCVYSSRDLVITISTTLELPAITALRQEQMRQNMNKLKGETKADTIIKRSHPLFYAGTADWTVNAIHETNAKKNTSFNLDIGAIFAGGETDLYLKYTTNIPFQLKEQYYHWRYVNNDHAALRQLTLGRILTQSTSTIYSPVTGVQFTNTPTTYRKSFGTYRLSDKTEAGSIVELYVNNELVDYTKADASGFYTFEIPLVYGNSIIKLRFYGISGEDRSREQYISIPFNFIPLHQLEYSLNAGIVGDNNKSRFARGVVNYGLTRNITLGTGAEYLSSVVNGKSFPFLSVSIQASSNLLVSGEYTHGVRAKGIIHYRLPSNVELSVTYIKYATGQTAIKNNYLEEKKAVLSMPFHNKYFNGLSRLTVNQFVLPGYKNTNAEFILSGVLCGISSNLTTYAQISTVKKELSKPVAYSNLSFTFRLPKSLRITPQIKYSYDIQQVSIIKCELEKKIFRKGYINFSYEKNIVNKEQYLSMTVRYNFSFAQTSLSARQNRGITTTTLSARGSILYDAETNYLGVSNQTIVGKGGVIILPFLDINCNGLRDHNEPKVPALNFHINGGKAERNRRDSTIHIVGLSSYSNYIIDLDNNFDNIAWQITKKKINVFIDPNHQTLIQIPIAVVGEVSGTVYNKGAKTANESARLTITFYNSNANQVAQTLTEIDGSFTFMGLAPGKYTAGLDAKQLEKLQLTATVLSFTILPNKEGDIVGGLKFILQALPEGNTK